MRAEETEIPGCILLHPNAIKDSRGVFVKTFQATLFKKLGLDTEFKEDYFSISRQGVLRGMHFQIPPGDHSKLVYCIDGSVLDVVLDLRRDLPSYGEVYSTELDSHSGKLLYIPSGCAHGFYTRSANATMVYKTTSEYDPQCDQGILWSSIPLKWPDDRPQLSDRDETFSELQSFDSPFTFREA